MIVYEGAKEHLYVVDYLQTVARTSVEVVYPSEAGEITLSRDPFLFRVEATLRDGTTFEEIEEAVTEAIAEVAAGKVPVERIEAVKSHARYYFLLGLETPKDVAVTIAMLVSATGDVGAICVALEGRNR